MALALRTCSGFMTFYARRVFGLTAVIAATGIAALRAQLPQPVIPWQPPAGIPAPSFGIVEQPGTPTHYVDNTNTAATDTLNPNGSPTRPRLTVPTALPAGAVVEVRGGPYNLTASSTIWYAAGTSDHRSSGAAGATLRWPGRTSSSMAS